jgi:isochorismate synthase
MTFAEELRTRLRKACFEASDRAARAGQPVIASVTVEAPDFEPVDLYESAGDSRRVFWLQPSEDFAMVAIGESRRVMLNGAPRFDEARSCWRRMLDLAVGDESDAPFAAPVALAGFAFSPLQRDEDSVFPDGVLTVPRLLFARGQGRAWVNATLDISAGADIDPQVGSLISEARACLHGASACARPGPACVRLIDGKDQQEWEGGVSSILSEIEAGRVEKAVLARAVELEAETEFSIPEALRRLEKRYPQCTIFAFTGNDASFLGATPERLLRLKDGTVSVDSLAGSIARGRDEEQDQALASRLLHDPKELHEHRVVTEAIEQNLSPLCSAVEAAPEPRILSFANVHHLYTPVSAVTKPGKDIFDFVEALHPTPATGGYPRAAALELIRRYESFDRGWYAGPCGWTDRHGNGEFVMAIRSALVEGNRAILYAGSGIVAGSDPAREYQETSMKLQAMLWALGQE